MVQFSDFDTRGYRTVDVATGYGKWVGSYEQTVEDAMDIALLEELAEPRWGSVRRAADLGCGTGRTAAWLRRNGVASVDGVDITPEMLAVARSRGGHDRLLEGDVRDTGLDGGAYDLVIASLIDEHLPDLRPFYAEAWRLARPGAACVVVAFHPHFIMTAGMPTHFTSDSGEPIAITTHVHLLSEHVTAGLRAGWRLAEMREGVVDERWLAAKPQWGRFRHHPVSAALVWRKNSAAPSSS
jgi:SAM-dependent methyltransferase